MPQKPKLGQHFLADPAACRAIVEALGDLSSRTVIEIGPGAGAITDLLVPLCRRLLLVELDPALAARLRDRLQSHPHVQVVETDVLAFDYAAHLAPDETADVVGNLPYYITSPILLQLFAAADSRPLRRAVVMMQREVAERVAAAPGTRDYGLLSVTTQMSCQVDTLLTLPPTAFAPPPQVWSTVLRLTFASRYAELRVDPPGFERFLRACFAQKRKTLANNLRAAGYSSAALAAAWPSQLTPAIRAEAVGLEPLAELFRRLPPR